MNQQKLKRTYLKRIQKVLASVNVFFDLLEVDVDDFTEEALYIECWEMEQMQACANNQSLYQLYKLWCSRVDEIQSLQFQEEIVIGEAMP